jgi:hypothetical protein
MTRLGIGILAEDRTDCEALETLILRIGRRSSQISIRTKHYSHGGCSRLRRKAETNLQDLAIQGYEAAVLLHDLDRNPANGELNSEPDLRRQLETIRVPAGLRRLICVPIEELEAWFWADPEVVRFVGRGKGEAHANPHSIKKPKEALTLLSRGGNRRPRYSTSDNARLAARLDLELCARRCPSFHALARFVQELVTERAQGAM